ncbi:MAE_28990/MAE_18760 family HEPN-like nuclease [Enterococcus lactis]|uniref:MAE_28990/MAE_18760 family HEPN-like nuclease n=1 Tax=Enterococcus lactis TaxID=357441 RepID=UPI0039A73959
MKKNFEKLVKEIDLFLELLEYMENQLIGFENDCSIFVLEIVDKDKCEAVFKSLKSNVILMMYNLIESTVRLTMNAYYDEFNDKKLSYKSLVEEIKKTWIKQSLGMAKNGDSIQKSIYEMIELAVEEESTVEISFEQFTLSGNADLREIKEIMKNHGIEYDEKNFKTFGGSLKSIKDMRNSLAHGNVSFQDNGRELTISELKEYQSQTYQCLNYFMNTVENSIYQLTN